MCTTFNVKTNDYIVADCFEDIKPKKYETVYLPIFNPEENTTFENSNENCRRRRKRRAKGSLRK